MFRYELAIHVIYNDFDLGSFSIRQLIQNMKGDDYFYYRD